MSSAIWRLPAELLADIFLALAVDGYDAACEDEFDAHEYTSDSIVVSHVCTQWRHVALNTPALWSYFEPKIPFRFFCEFLIRSKDVPLYVFIGKPWRTIPHAPLEAIAQHMSRVRELRLAGWLMHLSEACKALAGPAPTMHKLALIYPGYPWSLVEARGTLFDWSVWSPPSTLTTLVSIRAQTDPPVNDTMAQLLAVLDQTPRLETLRLQHTIPSPPSTAGTQLALGRRVCRLDKLKAIDLTGKTSHCASLLLHLSFPISATTSLSVVAFGSAHEGDLRQTLVERVSRLPRPDSLTISPTLGAFLLAFSPGRTASAASVEGREPDRTVRIEICADEDYTDGCAILGDLLPTFVAVRRLRVCLGSVMGLTVLCKLLGVAENAGVALPCLRELVLEDVVFESPLEGEQPPVEQPPFEALRDWLMERCNWDVPVETLRMETCYYVTQEHCRALGEIVADMRWDEEAMYSDYIS